MFWGDLGRFPEKKCTALSRGKKRIPRDWGDYTTGTKMTHREKPGNIDKVFRKGPRDDLPGQCLLRVAKMSRENEKDSLQVTTQKRVHPPSARVTTSRQGKEKRAKPAGPCK